MCWNFSGYQYLAKICFEYVDRSAGEFGLKHLSRDPANPDGYLNQAQLANINEISLSYLKKALNTYKSNSFKAASVMIGAAAGYRHRH